MTRSAPLAVLLFASAALAQDAQPAAANEVGRFKVLTSEELLQTIRLDTVTGNTWRVCRSEKPAPERRWCPVKIQGTLKPGPVGRYQLAGVTADKPASIMLLDSASGRSWYLCDGPLPEKVTTWCSLGD
jgi:hypothetical protein